MRRGGGELERSTAQHCAAAAGDEAGPGRVPSKPAHIPTYLPMRREATCVSKSHNDGGFSKHVWLLNGYEVISLALFPSAALEKASQRQSKIHLICLRSEVAFRLPFFLVNTDE